MYILATILLLGFFLRAYQLDRALGGHDENQILLSWVYMPLDYIVTPGGHSFITFEAHPGTDHVFHNIVLRIMVLLFGEENALAIRFPAFVAGIACLWMVYKIARQIFPSKAVAQLAVLTIALCPTHIYYSQTARGYSFVMFFSTLSIYATLKLLKSDKFLWWGLLLFLSGILSVYTMFLSVIFILGLAIWILLVLTIPTLKTEFGFHQEPISRKFYQLFLVFLLMGISSVLLYWPHIDGMLQMLNKFNEIPSDLDGYTKMYDNSEIDSSDFDRNIYSPFLNKLIYFIPNLFLKIFSGPLIYFTPFLIAGIFWSKTLISYRLFPIVILLTTYLFTLTTGLAYFPRGYLFNLPLFLIFLASGFMWTGEKLGNLIKTKTPINWMGYSLIGAYTALSLTEIFLNHYPSIKTYNVEDYRRNLSNQTQKNDLLLVSDGRMYLYARSIYKKNLQNIIADNQLGGIKLLVNNSLSIEDYKVKTLKGVLPVFFNWQEKPYFKSVSQDRKLIHLNETNSTSLLSKDFETATNWKIHSGVGDFATIKEHKFSGEYSLLTKASPENNMVLQSLLGQIELDQPHLIVLVWSTKKFANDDKFFMPVLEVSSIVNGKKSYGQVPLGKTNEGMSLFIKEKPSDEETYYWQVHSAIGWLPAGKSSVYMYLKCEAGKSIMYDSLRLFLVNKASQPEGRFTKEGS